MPRFPADRRGANEKLEHYLTRLESVRNKFLQSTPHHALSEFVTKFRWKYFCTFEFDFPFISYQAAESIFRSYLNRHRYLYSYYCIEFDPMLHCHALIHSKELERWSYGTAEIEPVTEQNGAAYYIQQHYRAEWNFHNADWMKYFQRLNKPTIRRSERPEITELRQLFLRRLRLQEKPLQ